MLIVITVTAKVPPPRVHVNSIKYVVPIFNCNAQSAKWYSALFARCAKTQSLVETRQKMFRNLLHIQPYRLVASLGWFGIVVGALHSNLFAISPFCVSESKEFSRLGDLLAEMKRRRKIVSMLVVPLPFESISPFSFGDSIGLKISICCRSV